MERDQFVRDARPLLSAGRSDATPGGGHASPTCPIHPGSAVRRFRATGVNGPGVYPQCVPGDGSQPHLLTWSDVHVAPAFRAVTPGLSPSELEVLADAAHGMTVIETATMRSKSPETVKTQRCSIILKMGARNIAHAVGMAITDGRITMAHAA
jgi:DNA-binding CsgD family transcriptional regulator